MAEAHGVAVNEILKGLGLPQALFDDPENKVRLADYFRIQNQIQAALEDETCNLSTRQLLPGTTDYILSHLTGVKSLTETMKTLARSYNLIHGGEYNSVRKRGEIVSFVIDVRAFPFTTPDNPEHIAFSMECVQIFLHCMLKIVAPSLAEQALRKIAVPRARRDEDSGHLACWAAPIEFGASVYSLDYDASLAAAAISSPPMDALTASRVFTEIFAMADKGVLRGVINQTEDFVRSALGRGVIDQTRIAALLGVSTATLRRRLEEEGTTFRVLRRDVLNEAAKALLKQHSASEVAEELGFSEIRSFNRAFKAWNGETPTAYAARISRQAI